MTFYLVDLIDTCQDLMYPILKQMCNKSLIQILLTGKFVYINTKLNLLIKILKNTCRYKYIMKVINLYSVVINIENLLKDQNKINGTDETNSNTIDKTMLLEYIQYAVLNTKLSTTSTVESVEIDKTVDTREIMINYIKKMFVRSIFNNNIKLMIFVLSLFHERISNRINDELIYKEFQEIDNKDHRYIFKICGSYLLSLAYLLQEHPIPNISRKAGRIFDTETKTESIIDFVDKCSTFKNAS